MGVASLVPEPPPPTLTEELAAMQRALFFHQQAYNTFLESARRYDFVTAGKAQETASAMMDAAMDAWVRACRVHEEKYGGDGA